VTVVVMSRFRVEVVVKGGGGWWWWCKGGRGVVCRTVHVVEL